MVVERVPTPPQAMKARRTMDEGGPLAAVVAHKWWLLAGAIFGAALTLVTVALLGR